MNGMKRLFFSAQFIILLCPLSVQADDVIPSVSREEMSAYKNTFGKAISDSRRAERPDAAASAAPGAGEGSPKGNFGAKVSDAARNLKADILKDNKNFGAWVSKQRSQRPDDGGGASSKGGSESSKASAESNRPSGKGKSEETGKKNNGHGQGKGKGN